MGVDISHIIRHDFRDVKIHAAAMDFVKETIERLKKNLHIYGADDEFELRVKWETITFHLPVYDVEFELHNGFWNLESYYHYCQIVMHDGDYFGLRRKTYDIAKALGQNEAWYAEEYYTWNGGNIEDPDVPLEDWIEFVHQKHGPISEFDPKAIMQQGDVPIPDYEPVYHDSFKECNDTFNEVQSKLKGYTLLGLEYIGNDYYRCENEAGLYLIHSETFKPMFNEPIETMLQNLNGPEFVIKKNGLSAVFDMDGKQLTDFEPGVFYWKWTEIGENGFDPNHSKRTIFNEKAKIKLPPR